MKVSLDLLVLWFMVILLTSTATTCLPTCDDGGELLWTLEDISNPLIYLLLVEIMWLLVTNCVIKYAEGHINTF